MVLPWSDGDDGERVPVSQGRCRATGTALGEASSRMRLSVPTVSSAVPLQWVTKDSWKVIGREEIAGSWKGLQGVN